jgi:uncharacterized protein (TIGR02301 family)
LLLTSRRYLAALALLAWLPLAGSIQQTLAQAAPSAAQRTQQLPPPAYDPQLLRLSQILGSIHYLQTLCQPTTAQSWRDQMQAILAAEQPDDDRKGNLIAAFNRGFHSYASVHRRCSPSARAVVSQYMREGEQLTKVVVSRFGQ